MLSDPELDALIQTGLALERAGSEQQAIDYFSRLVSQYPDNARVQFETGGAYDFAGYEAEAIPYYEKAIALGLDDQDAIRVEIQLGSSLRNVGRHDEAIARLKQASADHPDDLALRAFYALALTSGGQSTLAVVELLDALLRHPEALPEYRRSLRYYTDALREEIQS